MDPLTTAGEMDRLGRYGRPTRSCTKLVARELLESYERVE